MLALGARAASQPPMHFHGVGCLTYCADAMAAFAVFAFRFDELFAGELGVAPRLLRVRNLDSSRGGSPA